MDPLSTTASSITVIGVLGQSCLLVFKFLRDALNAPKDVRHHLDILEAFYKDYKGLRDSYVLHARNVPAFELTPDFYARAAAWKTDFDLIETKLRQADEELDKDVYTRTLARTKWSISSEHWLRKALGRVQDHHNIFTRELLQLQMQVEAISLARG